MMKTQLKFGCILIVGFVIGLLFRFPIPLLESGAAPTPKNEAIVLTERSKSADRLVTSLPFPPENIPTQSTKSHSIDNVELPRSALDKINFPLFLGENSKLSEGRLKALGLSDEQSSAVVALVENTLESLKTLEAAHSELKHDESGDFLKIHEFKNEGFDILENLNIALHGIIPDGRADLLEANLKKDVRFGDSGQSTREIAAEATDIGGKKIWGYSVHYITENSNKTPASFGGNAYNNIILNRYRSLFEKFSIDVN